VVLFTWWTGKVQRSFNDHFRGTGNHWILMARGKKKGNAMVIGKKYKLVYMNMSNKKN
jgi:hypothetical protein